MLWAMKDYCVKESWIQLFKINFTGLDSTKSIYRFPDGDVLFDVYTLDEGGYFRSFTTSKGPIQLWFDWFHSFYEYSNTFCMRYIPLLDPMWHHSIRCVGTFMLLPSPFIGLQMVIKRLQSLRTFKGPFRLLSSSLVKHGNIVEIITFNESLIDPKLLI
ncbi:hypothetical protein H5410_027998 [Solanum commersonii]|uniref:Uncharacterized protein n=1 Tax=Solanum commersonii TaxID=4109 RepID=A0A9J5Z1E7_SOLCO|nr:hypothetical protein H5410_027998 [Solanum commersonii]